MGISGLRILSRKLLLTLGGGRWELNGTWTSSGYGITIDADRGRDIHPWIVLPPSWQGEDEAKGGIS